LTTMLMTLGQLRALLEMKLGVAGAEGDARHWGKKPLPDEPIYEPGKPGSEYIATEDPPNYDPGEATRALYRGRGGVDMAGDEIDDELEDTYADMAAAGHDVDAPVGDKEDTGMRATMPRKRAG